MKKSNLLQFAECEMLSSAMHSVRGGGISCKGSCPGGDTSASVNATMQVMRDKNKPRPIKINLPPLPADSIPNDSIPNDSIPR